MINQSIPHSNVGPPTTSANMRASERKLLRCMVSL